MSFSEYVCPYHSSWVLRFQKPKPRPVSLSSYDLHIRMQLSFTSPTPGLPTCHHVPCHHDDALNLWNFKHDPTNFFFIRVAIGIVSPHSNKTLRHKVLSFNLCFILLTNNPNFIILISLILNNIFLWPIWEWAPHFISFYMVLCMIC